ncbi:hypothetical protein Golob_026193, partial [Gossypium lobatum]|nr:hypothetical protein [Gossypium lobatum]
MFEWLLGLGENKVLLLDDVVRRVAAKRPLVGWDLDDFPECISMVGGLKQSANKQGTCSTAYDSYVNISDPLRFLDALNNWRRLFGVVCWCIWKQHNSEVSGFLSMLEGCIINQARWLCVERDGRWSVEVQYSWGQDIHLDHATVG